MYNILYNIYSCLHIALYVQGVSESSPIVCIVCLEHRPARQLLRRPFFIPMNYADLMHLSSYEKTHGGTDREMDRRSLTRYIVSVLLQSHTPLVLLSLNTKPSHHSSRARRSRFFYSRCETKETDTVADTVRGKYD